MNKFNKSFEGISFNNQMYLRQQMLDKHLKSTFFKNRQLKVFNNEIKYRFISNTL